MIDLPFDSHPIPHNLSKPKNLILINPYRVVVVIILLSSILFPSIPVTADLRLRLEDFIAITLLIYYLFRKLINPFRIHLISPKRLSISFGLLLLTISMSWIYSMAFLNIGFQIRDSFEIIKPILYAVLFITAYKSSWSVIHLKRLSILLLFAINVSALISIVQYLGVGSSLVQKLVEIYGVPEHNLIALNLYNRITGTTANSNNLGVLMAFSAAISFSFLIWSTQRYIRLLAFITIPVTILVLSLTISRTAFASLLLGIFSNLGMILIKLLKSPKIKITKNKFKTSLILIFLISVGGIFLLTFIPGKFYNYVVPALKAPINDSSFSKRLNNWDNAFSIAKQSPIFGWGPAKLEQKTWIDNDYLLIFRRYGLLGFVSFVTLIASVLISIFPTKVNDPLMNAFNQGIWTVVLIALIAASTTTIYYSPQFMALLASLIGLSISLKKSAHYKTQINK